LILDADISTPLFLREALMDFITMDWRYILTGLATLFGLALWWNGILMEEIWDDCMDLARGNRNMKVKIEVLKAGRR
jgi:hypothetical protein